MALAWSLLFVHPAIIVSTIFCGSWSWIYCVLGARGHTVMKIARAWAHSIVVFAGIKVTVEGLEKVDLNQGCVFVSNHLSYMDTPVLLTYLPAEFRFLAKEGLFGIPFLGTYLRQGGHIAVPRDDPRASIRALAHAAQTIRDQKISVLIFPEGGRSFNGELQPFKEGAAYIAIKAGVPLIPMALIGTREIMMMHTVTVHRGKVRLRIGDPIPTCDLTIRDRESLAEAARLQILALSEPA